MSAFIETSISDQPALVNLDAIETVAPMLYFGEEKSLIRWRRPYERDPDIVCFGESYHIEMNENVADELYASLKAKILKAVENSKEKENIPPIPL